MKISFLGGAMEVGGSCIYFRVDKYGILMDAGIRQGNTKDPIPDFFTIQEQGGIDAIIISHAHLDHIGTLPIISKAYPQAKIYMTNMTLDLIRVLLYDSLKIMDRREDELPYYSEVDVRNMMERIHPLRYETPMKILDDLTLTLYQAGHIAGAACVYLDSREGSIFYSGDFATFSQRTIEGAKIPKLRPDVAILESTYGNRLHANRQAEENRLVELVQQCVKNNMKILIPAFALGRAQEVLLILRKAMSDGAIGKIPVYVDGMVRDINSMYYRNPSYLKNLLAKRIWKGNEPFYTEEIRAVLPNESRNDLLEKDGPAVFVASSGMLTGGPSMLYAKKIATMENGCIIITGYQDEESPGRALLNLLEETEKRMTIDGITIPVKCRIEQVGLSAHGDKSEIEMMVDRLSARRVFLVHGDREAINDVGKSLSEDFTRHIYMPNCGESFDLDIKNKRKQISQLMPYSMQKNIKLTADGQCELWKYCREHYTDKKFTLYQLAFVWYGRHITDEDELQKLQSVFMSSPYFAPNSKRLFLFEANSEEQVLENTSEKELTNQELEVLVKELANEIPYKKIGYFADKKAVVLTMDFPDVCDRERCISISRQFEEKTGWSLELSSAVNHQAMSVMLHSMFAERLVKCSYYQEKKQYVITLTDNRSDDEKCICEFRDKTGWSLCIKGFEIKTQLSEENNQIDGTKYGIIKSEDMTFNPKNSVECIEQNLAFSCIEHSFEGKKVVPYKKSIKNDTVGKYIELSFLSPRLGESVSDTIQEIADMIGWRIKISESVNQNAIMSILQSLCDRYNVKLAKNPSYLPQEKAFRIKLTQDMLEVPAELYDNFLGMTGCEVRC